MPLVQCLLTVSSSGEAAVGVPVWTIVANELSVTMVSVVVSIEVVLVLVGSSKKEKKSFTCGLYGIKGYNTCYRPTIILLQVN